MKSCQSSILIQLKSFLSIVEDLVIIEIIDYDTPHPQDLSDIIDNLSSLALKDSVLGSANTNGPQVLINSDRHKPSAQSSSDDSEFQVRKPSNVSIHRRQSADKVIILKAPDRFN